MRRISILSSRTDTGDGDRGLGGVRGRGGSGARSKPMKISEVCMEPCHGFSLPWSICL